MLFTYTLLMLQIHSYSRVLLYNFAIKSPPNVLFIILPVLGILI